MSPESLVTEEEQQEAMRHDRYYQARARVRKLRPYDWEKFDLIAKPTHGYVYSVKCLGDIRGKKVLDLGCGTGWLSVILAKRGAYVEGIDISSQAIHVASEMAKINEVDANTNFTVGSVYKLCYPDQYFDLVIGQAIIHHVRDKASCAAEIFRVLRGRGRAVFFEAFGNSRILERIRLLMPVPVDEEDRSHWDEQLKYHDLSAFRLFPRINHWEFQLLSRLDRLISNPALVSFFGRVDLVLLKNIPSLRSYARTIVIELMKSGEFDEDSKPKENQGTGGAHVC